MRKMYGAITIASVATGRISASTLSHGRVPGGIDDVAGNRWVTRTENTMTSAIATTNSGRAVIASRTTEVTWSNTLSRRAAAIKPRTPATSVPMMPAATTSVAELTSRGPISVDTL